jgi:hypothetical protein
MNVVSPVLNSSKDMALTEIGRSSMLFVVGSAPSSFAEEDPSGDERTT